MDFEGLSKEKKKRYIAQLLIRDSGAMPVEPPAQPVAIVMAGLPGAGKTEFLDSLTELLVERGLSTFVRIDLDQIVTVFPHYTPQRYDKFRSEGNLALTRAVDTAREGNYNMMIDGTFSGVSGASVANVERLLGAGYAVEMYYMHDDAATAWGYTKAREIETKRGITKEGFINACQNIQGNLKIAMQKFRDNKSFSLSVVVQKALRDKDYNILSERQDVDDVIGKGYNIDKLRDIL